jgi:hypothetical protein
MARRSTAEFPLRLSSCVLQLLPAIGHEIEEARNLAVEKVHVSWE